MNLRKRKDPMAKSTRDQARSEGLERTAYVLKYLSDPTRLKVVAHLSESGESNVTELTAAVGTSQPAMSHHLSLMLACGLVSRRRQGKHNFYKIGSVPGVDLAAIVAASIPVRP